MQTPGAHLHNTCYAKSHAGEVLSRAEAPPASLASSNLPSPTQGSQAPLTYTPGSPSSPPEGTLTFHLHHSSPNALGPFVSLPTRSKKKILNTCSVDDLLSHRLYFLFLGFDLQIYYQATFQVRPVSHTHRHTHTFPFGLFPSVASPACLRQNSRQPSFYCASQLLGAFYKLKVSGTA